MPPEFNLRPPAPGAPRPQETPSDKLARNVLNEAGPGKPGEQAPNINLRADAGVPTPGSPLGPSPEAAVTPQSLASRLLDHANTGDAGVAVNKRETTPLKDVY
jgi:hypothetical protein